MEKFHLDPEMVLPSTPTRLERSCQLGQSLFDLYRSVIVSTDAIAGALLNPEDRGSKLTESLGETLTGPNRLEC